MTPKDFHLIARTFAATQPTDHYPERVKQWGYCVIAMAAVLADKYPRFNRTAFVAACERG